MAWTWTALSSVEGKAKATAETVSRRTQRIRNGLREAYFVLPSDSPTSSGKHQSCGETSCLFTVSFQI